MRFFASARPAWAACAVALFGHLSSHSGTACAATDITPDAPSALAAGVRSAWSRHPAADAVEQTLSAARARADAADRPLYNPELEFAYDDEGEDRTATAGIALTLDVSGKRRSRAEWGQAELNLAEAEASLRRTAFAQSWLQGWADYRTAQDRVRRGEQRVALVARFADLAQRQFDVGDVASLERDLALLARDQAQAEQSTLLADAAIAEEAFRSVGGDPAMAATDAVPGAPPPWDAVPELRVGALPEVQVAAATAASAARRITLAERDRRPDPTLALRGGRIDLGPASDNVLGMTISVPLFVRNDFRADVAAASGDAGAADAELRRVELESRARADRTVHTFEVVRQAWEQWSASPGTDVSRRADLLERLWRAGELSTADYLLQLRQSLDTALAGADLQGRLWRSYVDALYATGRLDAWVGFDRSNLEVIR